MRIALATLHLLGMAIAVGAIYVRARVMNSLGDIAALKRGLTADTWWGISFLLLLVTGLWRAFGSVEKSSAYYWSHHVFYAKMGLLIAILALEVWPMVTLIRWRIADGRGGLPPMESMRPIGKRIARISDVQAVLLVGIVVAAVMLARGYGTR